MKAFVRKQEFNLFRLRSVEAYLSVSDGIVRNQIFFLQSQFDNLIIIEVENGRHGVQNEFSKVVDVRPRRKFGSISLQTTAWAVADVVAGWPFKKK